MDKFLIKNLDWARAGASPARTLLRFDTRPENAFCRGAPGQGQAQPVPCYELMGDTMPHPGQGQAQPVLCYECRYPPRAGASPARTLRRNDLLASQASRTGYGLGLPLPWVGHGTRSSNYPFATPAISNLSISTWPEMSFGNNRLRVKNLIATFFPSRNTPANTAANAPEYPYSAYTVDTPA